MISDFFYYLFYSSAILIYGIGINRATILCETPENMILKFIKMLISVCGTAVITYAVVTKILIKCNMAELFPFIAIVLFCCISVFLEAIIRLTAKNNTSDFAVSFLIILLAVNESSSLLQCFIICIFCTVGFFAIIPFLYAIRKRIEIAYPSRYFKNSSLIFISIAVIMIILAAYSASWLNPEVFR